ncbi:MAG: hypothetical protein IPM42_05855 [Saprospiraceae bacterium]|nr:hypothetical protein [Saprospiraceae bacterium]
MVSGKDLLNIDAGSIFFNDFKCVGTNIVMPITYLKPLEASSKNNDINLTWSTANQFNNERYIVEHSPNGRNFLSIGEISGDGTNNETKHYE